MEKDIYDVIVIGKGPSAMTCGIYTKRAGLNVLAIAKDFGSMQDTTCENYYSKMDTTLREIAEDGIEQFEDLGGELKEDEVVDISYDGNNYIIYTLSNNIYYAKYIFLGLGANRKKLKIEGLEEYDKKGVSYCTVCDAFLYNEKDVLLICKMGNLERELNQLEKVANKIYVIIYGNEQEEIIKMYNNNPNIVFLKSNVSKIYGDEKVCGVILDDGTDIPLSGVFVSIGITSGMLSAKLNIQKEGSEIVVGDNNMTSANNIYAGGDITKGPKQVTKACYDGMIAAYDIIGKNN